MKLEVYGKQGCARCQAAKNKLSHFVAKWGRSDRVSIEFIDMETVDGLAESAFRDVSDIPVTILIDNGRVLARWDGEVPASEDLRKAIEGCVPLESK
jgi:hypothetical protein